jgi:valyl-tRNA synthetase
MVAEFPKMDEKEIYPQEEAQMELIRKVIGAIRNLRSEMEIPPGKKVEVILHSPNEESLKLLEGNRLYVENLAKAERITLQSRAERPKASATAVVGEVEVFLPLKGLINLDDEEKRLQKERSKISEDLTRTHLKLQNQEFLERARPEAVEKEREKAKALGEREAKLKEGLERVRAWKNAE